VLPLSWRDRLAREAADRRSLPRARAVGRIHGLPVRYEHCTSGPILAARRDPIRHYLLRVEGD
jgi:hypothetical protein